MSVLIYIYFWIKEIFLSLNFDIAVELSLWKLHDRTKNLIQKPLISCLQPLSTCLLILSCGSVPMTGMSVCVCVRWEIIRAACLAGIISGLMKGHFKLSRLTADGHSVCQAWSNGQALISVSIRIGTVSRVSFYLNIEYDIQVENSHHVIFNCYCLITIMVCSYLSRGQVVICI